MKITVIDSTTGHVRLAGGSIKEFSDWVFDVWNVSKSASLEKKIESAKSGGWIVVFN